MFSDNLVKDIKINFKWTVFILLLINIIWIHWQDFTLDVYQTLEENANGTYLCYVLVSVWYIFFSFYFYFLLSLKLGPAFSKKIIQSDNLCLLLGVFTPFTLNMVMDILRLIHLAVCHISFSFSAFCVS